METDFLFGGNSVFWSELFFCWWKLLLELGGKQFSKKELIIASGQLLFWLVENIFFLYFSETPASDSFFFCLVETMFQESPSFQLVETDFRANNGFRKKKEKL